MFTAKRTISANLNNNAVKILCEALDLIDGFFYAAADAGADASASFTDPETGETFSAEELGRACGILHGLIDTKIWVID